MGTGTLWVPKMPCPNVPALLSVPAQQRRLIEEVRRVKPKEILGVVQTWKQQHDRLPLADQPAVRAEVFKQLREWQKRDVRQY